MFTPGEVVLLKATNDKLLAFKKRKPMAPRFTIAGLQSQIARLLQENKRISEATDKVAAEGTRQASRVTELQKRLEDCDGQIGRLKNQNVELKLELARFGGYLERVQEEDSADAKVWGPLESMQPLAYSTDFSFLMYGGKVGWWNDNDWHFENV